VTYSIVARDGATGEIGVAVQSAMFDVGATVPWAEAGVGAVATQAFSERSYGPRCLEALAAGHDAPSALAAAQATDPMAIVRQVGVVGADGSAATVTGAMCIDCAGGLTGAGFVVQANMMRNPDVWPAMARAYETSSGPLARRLLGALFAAEVAGGDARGVMSAALKVVGGETTEPPGGDVVVDLRVDRSADPLGELSRLLDAADAFAEFHQAVDHLTAGQAHTALDMIERALARLPGEPNFCFVRAGALLAVGDLDAGRQELRALVGADAGWEGIVRSFAAKGLSAPLPSGITIDDLLRDS